MLRNIVSSAIINVNDEQQHKRQPQFYDVNVDVDVNFDVGLSAFLIADVNFLKEFNGSTTIDNNESGSGYGLLSFIFNDTTATTTISNTNFITNSSSIVINNDEVVVLIKMTVMSIVLGLMILITIIGNVFVIAAIILERNLQNVGNYLVASLAVADLLVACLVMPLGAVYEISEGWILGAELCDIWTSCDVLCCTASILHLVAIATDRYWTVTNIDYHNLRTPQRIFFMIFCVWFAAVIVSLAPQFGWKDPDYMTRIEQQKCMVSQDVAYQIFATCCTFYVPLLVILILYWKIYKIARKRIQRRSQKLVKVTTTATQYEMQQRKKHRLKICFGTVKKTEKYVTSENWQTSHPNQTLSIPIMREETEFSTSNFDSKSHIVTEVTTLSGEDADDELQTTNADEISTVSQQIATTTHQQRTAALFLTTHQIGGFANNSLGNISSSSNVKQLSQQQKLAKRRQILEAKRERKAAQTLAIITGAFVVCWLPFFVMALMLSLCKSCEINAAVASLFLWLGYFNSTLNPIIYTIFNPEFRRAFKRILCGRKNFQHIQSGRI